MDLLHPSKDTHLAQISDLFARSFSDYWQWHDYIPAGYVDGAPYDWNASRIGIVDDQIATHFGVWDFSIRVGHSVLRVACIGAVGTGRGYRKKGLMNETASACLDGLAGAGYDISLLFGIQNFYGEYGYVCTFAPGSFTVETRDLVVPDSPVQFEQFTGRITELAPVYNSENDGITGTYVRPTYTRNRRPARHTVYSFDGGYVVAGRAGEALEIADCAGDPVAILDVCRQRAHFELTPRIEFRFLPRRSRMGEHLQTLSHSYSERFHRAGGAMVRIVNLGSTLEKIAPELSIRLRNSTVADYRGRLGIETAQGSADLEIADGTVKVSPPHAATQTGIVKCGDALGRFILGDTNPDRICHQHQVELSGDAHSLLDVLFPDQEPDTILWDRF